MRGGAEVMKKIFILSMLIPSIALAVKIDANTKIKWNAIVVVAALHDVGLEANPGTNLDVALTYDNILSDLLGRETFSVVDAVSVCMQQCNKCSLLKEGHGESGKKCPEICKNFGTALVTENNKGTNSIKLSDYSYHPDGRIYSSDKKFYALISVDPKSSQWCKDAIFESSTNKKIAVCTLKGYFAEDGADEKHFDVIDSNYKGFDFVLGCNYCITCENDEGRCSLHYVDTVSEVKEFQQKYEKCVAVYKSVDLSTVKSLSESPLIYSDLKKISDNAEKIFALRNDVYNAKSIEWGLSYSVDKYCGGISVASVNAMIANAKASIKCVRDNFKSNNILFRNTQTKTLDGARSKIVDHLRSKCEDGNWSTVKCTGDCNGPGKQDYVTCTFGSLQATFEFDDICDGNWKQKAKSFFGK